MALTVYVVNQQKPRDFAQRDLGARVRFARVRVVRAYGRGSLENRR